MPDRFDYKRSLGIGLLEVWRTSNIPYTHGERRDLLHVMSPAAGGQICGYQRPAGNAEPWRPQTPWYVVAWPELHDAVARVTRETVEVDGRLWRPSDGEQLGLFGEAST